MVEKGNPLTNRKAAECKTTLASCRGDIRYILVIKVLEMLAWRVGDVESTGVCHGSTAGRCAAAGG
jgi:hypothetical protein